MVGWFQRLDGHEFEEEMVGWHHRLNGHEFEKALGVGDGQGSLACYSPWGHRDGHDRVTQQQMHFYVYFLICPFKVL